MPGTRGRLWKPVLATFAALVLLPPLVWGELTRDEIRSTNAASQAAISTIQARVEVAEEINPEMLPRSAAAGSLQSKYVIEYTRSGNKERHREIEGPMGVRDVIRDDGSGKGSLFQANTGGQTIDQAMIAANKDLPVLLRVWELALFHLPWYEHPLSRLLDESEVKAPKSRSEAGRSLVYLDVRDSAGRRYEVYVDPGVNCLIRKLIVHRSLPNGDARLVTEVVSFQEPRPSVFFPERVVRSLFFRGKWTTKMDVTFTNVRVNEAVGAGFFEHSYPPGTRVTDQERNIWYTVPNKGQSTRTFPFTPSSPSVESLGPQSATGTSSPPTADEVRWPWHRLLLILSVISLVVGLGILLWKRRKARGAV